MSKNTISDSQLCTLEIVTEGNFLRALAAALDDLRELSEQHAIRFHPPLHGNDDCSGRALDCTCDVVLLVYERRELTT